MSLVDWSKAFYYNNIKIVGVDKTPYPGPAACKYNDELWVPFGKLHFFVLWLHKDCGFMEAEGIAAFILPDGRFADFSSHEDYFEVGVLTVADLHTTERKDLKRLKGSKNESLDSIDTYYFLFANQFNLSTDAKLVSAAVAQPVQTGCRCRNCREFFEYESADKLGDGCITCWNCNHYSSVPYRGFLLEQSRNGTPPMTENSAIYVRDLEDLFGMRSPVPFLFCETCGSRYSAHKGDYFMVPGDFPLECCGIPLRRVVETVSHVDV